MKTVLKKIISNVYDSVYPPRCPVCDAVLYKKETIDRPKLCKGCVGKIIYINQPSCMKCGKQLEDETEYCHDCLKYTHLYERGVAAFSYSKDIKRSLYSFKYENRREYVEFYADTIVDKYGHVISSWKPDVMVPVPLHPSKYRKRGYNQAEILANAISARTGIPVDTNILKRKRNTRAQKELDDKDRISNIKGAFILGQNGVKYRKILLVDDIYTTGTTIDECSRVLRANKVSEVYFVAICVGRGF